MAVDVMVPPDLWEDEAGAEEGVITTWLANPGGRVGAGALIAQVMVKKVQFDILAPAAGVLTILKPAETIVRRGDVIGRIEG